MNLVYPIHKKGQELDKSINDPLNLRRQEESFEVVGWMGL
jgi:hypothetical protein